MNYLCLIEFNFLKNIWCFLKVLNYQILEELMINSRLRCSFFSLVQVTAQVQVTSFYGTHKWKICICQVRLSFEAQRFSFYFLSLEVEKCLDKSSTTILLCFWKYLNVAKFLMSGLGVLTIKALQLDRQARDSM